MPETQLQPRPSGLAQIWRLEAFWFINALGFLWALVYNVLPISFPAFRESFGATIEQMGRSQLFFFVGGLLYAILGALSIGRLGPRRAAIASIVIAAASVGLMGSAANMGTIILGALLFGLALASLDVACSSLIIEHFSAHRQSFFLLYGVVGSFAGILGPAVLGWWQINGPTPRENWRTEFFVFSAILIPFAVWGLRLRSRKEAPQKDGVTIDGRALTIVTNMLGEPTIYLLGFTYLLHGAAQSGMVSWVGQLYQQRNSIDGAHAGYLLSMDLVGFFLGRSLLSWITARWRISELLLMGVCAACATLAYMATIAAPSYAWGLVCFMFSGFFISVDGPSINSYAGLHFAERAPYAYVLLSGIGSIGSAGGAYVTALIAQRFGIEEGIWFLPTFSAALSLLAITWWTRSRRQGRAR